MSLNATASNRLILALAMSAAALAGCDAKDPKPATTAMDDCAECCAVPATAPAAKTPATGPSTKPATDAEAAAGWQDLYDGKSLKNWKVADFAGHGEPEIENGVLVLPAGEGLTGITWQGEAPPKTNYEIEVVAKRIEGVDFFCGVTFPVNDSHASFIAGGWGGAVVGISNIANEDAAHNDTTTYEKFEKGRFYTLKVRVEPEKIQAWIDDKQVVNADIKGKKINVRGDIDQCKPLGVAAFATTSGIKSIKLRKLDAK